MRTVSAWLPAVIVAAVIFVFSAQQDLAISHGAIDLALRKVAHVTVYAALAVACLRGLGRDRPPAPWLAGAAFALTVLYAVSDEVHQTFVPTRHGSPVDVGIDAVGAVLGLLLVARVPPLRRAAFAGLRAAAT